MPARGLENNNYLNVKNGASRWMDGDGRESRSDSRGHAVFSDPAYGVRAGILLLRSYFFKHNLRTVAEILGRWAPASDTIGSLPGAPQNSPKEYATFVAGRMGISYNQKLDIFNEDKSIGNIAQLRELFFAMAAYEVGGGFKVPLKDFNAGLELLEPGIRVDGTRIHSTNTALISASDAAAAVRSKSRISGSVGRADKGAQNAPGDVKTIQEMLRSASMILRNPSLDPGPIDEEIVSKAKESSTVQAIEAFQSRFLLRPDGVIEPERRTWLELVRVLATGATPAGTTEQPTAGPEFCFPFAQLPSANWTSAPRSFAANRDNGRRAHAGCDLYFPQGTIIHAVAAGTVVRGPHPFYAGTYAIEIDHGAFLARYGEIQEAAMVRQGDKVVAGQPIAKVGHLVGIAVRSDMLHFELYDKSAHGPLTVGAAESAIAPNGRPFLRRKDLIDPTAKLNEWQTSLPGAAVSVTEATGAAARAIPARGFCIHVQRLREERRSSMRFARTVGSYQCYWNGSAIPELAGQMVERNGPGDNSTEIGDNRDLRICEGVYPLAIHDGANYKTHGYNQSGSDRPKPGVLLQQTDERTWILLHPGKDYVSSIGCLNPASGLVDADSKINFEDSRARVVAIIEAMKSNLGGKFPRAGRIPEALIVIDGEPTPTASAAGEIECVPIRKRPSRPSREVPGGGVKRIASAAVRRARAARRGLLGR